MSRLRSTLGLFALILLTASVGLQLSNAQSSAGPDPAYLDALWAGRGSGALKIDADDGQVLLELAAGQEIEAVAVDEVRGLAWLLAEGQLRGFGFDGAPVADFAVEDDDSDSFRLEAHDGNLWLGAGRRLQRFDAAGILLDTLALSSPLRDLDLDPVSGVVRAATRLGISSFDPSGLPAGEVAVSAPGGLRAIAIDRVSGAFWAATNKDLLRFAEDGTPELEVMVKSVKRLAADGRGGVWAVAKDDLLRFDAAGQLLLDVDLGEVEEVAGLEADLVALTAWIAAGERLLEVAADGQVLQTIAPGGPDFTDLAFYQDLISPELEFTAPAAGSEVEPRPELALAWSDAGQGVDPESLAITLGGAPVDVDCTTTAAGASCVPDDDLPAGEVTLSATVADFAGNTSPATEVTFTVLPRNRPPELAPIGDLTVALGSSLTLQLVATDPDGDPLVYAAGPVPLPELALLTSAGGLFTYTPTDDDVGSRPLTFTVSDGLESDSETLTLTVTGAVPGAPTSLSGRLLDTHDFVADGTETPIVGARITLDGTSAVAFSGADGRFQLSNLPFGQRVLRIDSAPAAPAPDGSPYASFQEGILLIEGVNNDVARPFFLPRIDPASATTVDPTTTTVVHNPNLGVTLTVPPNTAKNPDGTNYTGELTISEVPAAVAPVSLPEELEPGMLLTVQPVGVTFATPVPLTMPNIDGLTPGSEVDLWSVDPATGIFQIVGVGVVSADGTMIETVSGGIRAASWHALLPPQPGSDGSDNNDDNQDPDKCDDCNGGSQTALSSGNLSVAHDLTPYHALNRPRSLRLVYNSDQAAPRPILSSRTVISRRAAVPPVTSVGLSVAGLDYGPQLYTDTSGLSESLDEPLRQAVQLDAGAFATGRYRYRMKVSSIYSRSTISTFQNGEAIVHNLSDSPLGTGWGLSGLQRIHPQGDGSVLITEGNGKAQAFEPAPIDLRDWRRQGPAGNGNWIVAGDGLSVRQTINGNPTFFVSPTNFIDTVVRGRFRVETSSDDDFVGFVIGYRSPLAENGDPTNDFEFLLFDWKQNTQTFNGVTAREGFSLSRVNGTITNFLPGFWGHNDSADFQVLATDFGSDKGWSNFTEHDFELIYERDRIKISIDDRVIFDLAGTFEPGRFGFYNYSQAQVRYRSFTAAALFDSPPGDFSTLLRTDEGGYTRTFKDGSMMTFDADGLQTGAVDAAGNTSTYGYDAQGRLISVTDPVGGVTLLVYGAGRLQSITDPAGQTTAFEHDAGGRLTRIVDPDGSARRFEYDAVGRLIRQISKRGFAVDYGYDFAGRNVDIQRADGSLRSLIPKITAGLRDPSSPVGGISTPAPVVRPAAAVATYVDGNGNASVFDTDRFGGAVMTINADGGMTSASRDDAGNPTEIVNSNGSRQRFTYDERGNLTAVEWEDGGSGPLLDVRRLELGYDLARNQIDRLVDVGGNAFEFEYDGAGNATGFTDPMGGTRSATYDARGLLLTLTDELGETTTYAYDASGNTQSITDGAGVTVRFTRDAAGRVTAITEAFGLPEERTTAYAYDAAGRVSRFTDAGGAVTRFTYDASGNTTAIELPGGQIVRRFYDQQNRITRLEDPIRGATTFAYDGNGNLLELVKANGARTTFEYDAANRMVRSVDALAGEQLFTYDGRGNLLQFRNAAGASWSYVYDDFDRVTSVTDPLGNPTSFTYDPRNFLTSATDANGQTTTYTIDPLGRVTEAVLPGDVIRRTFDAAGNILAVEDGDSRVELTYDELGRLLTESVVDVGVQPATTLTYQRDALGRRTGLADSSGGTTAYAYDVRHLTGITTPAGEAISFAYDLAGRFQQLGLPNGVTTGLTYDAAGRLSSLSYADAGGTLLSMGYTYDVVGKLLAIAEGTRVRSFGYDALERLIDGGATGLPEFYDYDAVGNRVQSFLSAGHLHDAANRLLEDDAFTYAYDANGNLIRRTDKATSEVTTYTYDAQNQLIRVDSPGGGVATYRYDGIGRRIEKNVDGDVTRYVYDGRNILLEFDAAGALEARYTYGAGADQPLAMERGGASYYYLADHQGSIRFLLDAAGATVNSYEYDSFGRRLVASEGVENPFTFTGREYDAESGFYYYRARYYDPRTGRFVSQDPARFDSGSSNFYSYLENDPVNARDPSGMFSFWDALDVASFLWSAKEFIDCPGLGTGFNLLLDGVGLLPIIPGIGTVRRGIDLADSASDALRLGDRANDAIRQADNVNDAVNAADTASDLSRRAQDILGQGDDVVVIGRRPDTAVAGEWDGHTILDADDWSIDLNDAWVGEAIDQGRDVYVASPTTPGNLWDADAGRQTVFGREIQQFLDAGYTRQGDYLIPPGN